MELWGPKSDLLEYKKEWEEKQQQTIDNYSKKFCYEVSVKQSNRGEGRVKEDYF